MVPESVHRYIFVIGLKYERPSKGSRAYFIWFMHVIGMGNGKTIVFVQDYGLDIHIPVLLKSLVQGYR
jgi:hypothetical protein